MEFLSSTRFSNMETRLVTIYIRSDGQLFLHGHSRTTMGIHLACPPFIALKPAEMEKAPDVAFDLLLRPPETIPHPKIFDQLNPLFTLSDCRDWKQFSKGTSCLHVQQQGSEISIIPTQRDSAGFRHLNKDITKLNNASKTNSLLGFLQSMADFSPKQNIEDTKIPSA